MESVVDGVDNISVEMDIIDELKGYIDMKFDLFKSKECTKSASDSHKLPSELQSNTEQLLIVKLRDEVEFLREELQCRREDFQQREALLMKIVEILDTDNVQKCQFNSYLKSHAYTGGDTHMPNAVTKPLSRMNTGEPQADWEIPKRTNQSIIDPCKSNHTSFVSNNPYNALQVDDDQESEQSANREIVHDFKNVTIRKSHKQLKADDSPADSAARGDQIGNVNDSETTLKADNV